MLAKKEKKAKAKRLKDEKDFKAREATVAKILATIEPQMQCLLAAMNKPDSMRLPDWLTRKAKGIMDSLQSTHDLAHSAEKNAKVTMPDLKDLVVPPPFPPTRSRAQCANASRGFWRGWAE